MTKVGVIKKFTGPDWVFDLNGWFPRWKSKAEELKRSAELLWVAVDDDFRNLRNYFNNHCVDSQYKDPPSVLYVFVLLAGFSIENLLKGLIVIDHPDFIKAGKLCGKTITSHDLIFLAKEAKIDLADDEIFFCELASEAITGFGRYPLPKNASKMNSQLTFNTSIKGVYETLYCRLIEEFPNRYKNRKK